MLIEQIIKFQLRWPGAPRCTCASQLLISMTKQKHQRKILGYHLLLKYCWSQYTLFPPTWAKSITKFNTKVQDFKRILDLNCK